MMFKKQPTPTPPPSHTPPPDERVVPFLCGSCGLVRVPRSVLDAASPHSAVGVVPMSRPCGCGRLMRRAALR